MKSLNFYKYVSLPSPLTDSRALCNFSVPSNIKLPMKNAALIVIRTLKERRQIKIND